MFDNSKVDLDRQALAKAESDLAIRLALSDEAESIVRSAKRRAPRKTGAGAASIHQEMQLNSDGWTVEISWDSQHGYMGFQELGTSTMRPHSFLRPALEARVGTSAGRTAQ